MNESPKKDEKFISIAEQEAKAAAIKIVRDAEDGLLRRRVTDKILKHVGVQRTQQNLQILAHWLYKTKLCPKPEWLEHSAPTIAAITTDDLLLALGKLEERNQENNENNPF